MLSTDSFLSEQDVSANLDFEFIGVSQSYCSAIELLPLILIDIILAVFSLHFNQNEPSESRDR